MITSVDLKKLLSEQTKEWGLAKDNFEALNTVKTKKFDLDGFSINVQFNPARIQSSAAKVDTKSIQERKCFLCANNLPKVQKGLPYGDNYTVLVNPFPIFPEHFTIPTNKHTDQLILERYADMLDMAKNIEGYTLFYNGPKCGASAPDHAHFQAGNQGFLPIEKDIDSFTKNIVCKSSLLTVYTIENDLRNAILLEAKDKKECSKFFEYLYSNLEVKEDEKEPKLNILTWFKNDKWYSYIIPRENHRPSCFYAEAERNILISPASVDMGGVFIIPREADFDKITLADIRLIFKEVCFSNEKMDELKRVLDKYVF